jgi:hypothetical protein
MTSSRESIQLPVGCHYGEASHLEANHQLEDSRQWHRRIDMHDCLGHYVLNPTAHQIIVVGDHLAAGESKGAEEIEFGDEPQDFSVFHHWERIEVVLFE